MARIAALQRIPNGQATGEELLPVVWNGRTMGAPVSQVVAPAAQPFVDAAASEALAARLAKDQAADLVRAENIFVDVPLAVAEAAVAEGTTFKLVDSAAGWASVRKRALNGSTILYTETTGELLRSLWGAGTIGGRGLNGAALTLQQLLDRRNVIPFAELGGKADYNPVTGEGHDDSQAFDNAWLISQALNIPVAIEFAPNSRIKVTRDIWAWSGIRLLGDEAYTPTIYGIFTEQGHRIIASNPADPTVLKDVQIWGITLFRGGRLPANDNRTLYKEHGLLLDNMDGCHIDIRIHGDEGAVGGACGISAFYPENRPSKKCFVRVQVEYGGNFALQFGNVSTGTMELVSGKKCHREVIGLEPYALDKYRFAASAVAADVLYWPDHGLSLGYPLIYSREGANAFAGLATKSNYYFAVPVDKNHIRVADSKEEALANVPKAFGSATNATDEHAFIVCGVLRNITVKSSNIDTGDVVSGGSGTGSVIITATSGGYTEGISIERLNIIERNPTSGSIGIAIFGAKGWTIDGAELVGQNSRAVRAGKGTVNSIRNAKGDISPKGLNGAAFGLQVACEGIIRGVTAREFKGTGIEIDGDVIVEECHLRSTVATGPAILFTQDCEVNRQPLALRCTAKVPAVSPFVTVDTNGAVIGPILRQEGCRNLNNERNRIDFKGPWRIEQVLGKGLASVAAAGTVDADKTTLVTFTNADPGRGKSTFSGRVRITARQLLTASTNTAVYELDITKSAPTLGLSVNLIRASGLTAGGGQSHPSFAFGPNSAGALGVAVVGQTATNPATLGPPLGWSFDLEVTGDLVAI